MIYAAVIAFLTIAVLIAFWNGAYIWGAGLLVIFGVVFFLDSLPSAEPIDKPPDELI